MQFTESYNKNTLLCVIIFKIINRYPLKFYMLWRIFEKSFTFAYIKMLIKIIEALKKDFVENIFLVSSIKDKQTRLTKKIKIII